MKSPVQKSSLNLLYSNFRRVEDYDPSPSSQSHKRSVKSQKAAQSVKRSVAKKDPKISSAKDEFDELPLEQQIAEMLKPITNRDDVNENRSDFEEDSNLYQRDSTKLESRYNGSKRDYAHLNGYDIQTEANSQINDVNSVEVTRGHVSLPPIKGYDPFTSNKVVKHWHYHQPVKYSSMNSRVNSVNASGITESQRKSSGERQYLKDSSSTPNKYIQGQSNLKPLNNLEFVPFSKTDRNNTHHEVILTSQSVKNSRANQMYKVQKENSAVDGLNIINKGGQASELLVEMNKPISTDNFISSKKVNTLQNASTEASHLLHGASNSEKLDKLSKNLLDVNQAKSQRLLADANTKLVGMTNFNDEEFDNMGESKLDNSQGILNSDYKEIMALSPRMNFKSPEKRKKMEYYNKWYMPVHTWSVSKDSNSISKKYEQLKKDINFYYHNIHDYNNQGQVDPVKGKGQKSPQQVNYESLQDKMKQNMTIKKYKKQLAESNVRVPTFLRKIDE